MATFIPRLSVIAGKIEATAGTEETLAAADAAMVISDPQVDDNIDLIERNFLTSSLSKFSPLIGAKERRIRFTTEMKGSGTAGTPPETDAYFRACGMSVTNVASTSDTYDMTDPTETVTIGRWLSDGTTPVKKTIIGAMGAFSLEGSIGGAMGATFDFLGQYINVTDTALPASITPDTLKPPQLLAVTFTIAGFSPKISTITISGGQVVTLPGDITETHGKSVAIMTERAVEISFDAEMSTVAAHDWYGRLRDGTEGALSLAIGSTAGNRFTISCPKLQYVGIAEGERDNAAVVNITARANRSAAAGDDELSILFN